MHRLTLIALALASGVLFSQTATYGQQSDDDGIPIESAVVDGSSQNICCCGQGLVRSRAVFRRPVEIASRAGQVYRSFSYEPSAASLQEGSSVISRGGGLVRSRATGGVSRSALSRAAPSYGSHR